MATRREILGGLSFLIAGGEGMGATEHMATRPVPASGEPIPMVGLGTYRTMDVSVDNGVPAELAGVIATFLEAGGRVVDTSPMYGRAESALGALLSANPAGATAFVATKIWTDGQTEGEKQARESFRLLRRDKIDLLQIHNARDWRAHVPTLESLKASGHIRYTGLTHYLESAQPEVERILRRQPFDFVQINHSIESRAAERRLLPFCRDHGIAVLVNEPFEKGTLFNRVRGHDLPGWAPDVGCDSWAQFFLKFVLGHPAVTCVLPATARVTHEQDNVRAGYGYIPTPAERLRMAEYLRAL